jgi:glycosyltransferase involved in cell wall biosynthesis
MRIAVIAPPWIPVPPPAYGGTELVLDTLCRGLSAEGHDVLLVTTGDSQCPVERAWVYEESIGTEGASPAAEISHALAGYRAIASWRADIVHDHTLVGPFLSRRFDGLPVVTTNHGPFNGELHEIYRTLAPVVPVIAISASQARLAPDVAVAAVIHHGADLDQFEVGPGRGGYALFLGRMAPDKGVDAAARIARVAGVPLRIAAKMREPAEVAHFEACVEPLLGGDIEFVGEVGMEDKQALLRDAMCLLNPIQWHEPFGMVMIEALATGTPVVTTPMGSACEIIDDGVTGFVHEDEVALAAAVVASVDLDRAACRAACEERFSLPRMARKHIELYCSVVARRPTSRSPVHRTRPAATNGR